MPFRQTYARSLWACSPIEKAQMPSRSGNDGRRVNELSSPGRDDGTTVDDVVTLMRVAAARQTSATARAGRSAKPDRSVIAVCKVFRARRKENNDQHRGSLCNMPALLLPASG